MPTCTQVNMDTILVRVEPWNNGTKRLRVVCPLSVEVYSNGSWAAHLPVNGGDVTVIDGATEVHRNGWVPLDMVAQVLNEAERKVVEELLPLACPGLKPVVVPVQEPVVEQPVPSAPVVTESVVEQPAVAAPAKKPPAKAK